MIIVGIDPGLVNLGWGIIKIESYGKFKCLAFGSERIDNKPTLQNRLRKVHDILVDRLSLYAPKIGAIENTVVNSNSKTSLSLSQAKGAAMLSLSLCAVEVVEYSPTAIKKSVTGKGNADKCQIIRMVELLLGTEVGILSSHAADALAVAITHALHLGVHDRVITW